MLTGDHDESLHIAVRHVAHSFVFRIVHSDPRRVSHGLLSCLLGLHARLDRERKLALVPRVETPIGTSCLSFSLPISISLAGKRILPGNSAAQVVPVEVTVGGDESKCTPEDPSHFADHPDVGLAHVVCHVEHH